MDAEALLAVLQLADGLFPAGGFAHSLGLETYVDEGRVVDRAGVEAFLRAHLEGSAGPADAVAVAWAAGRAAVGDLTGCLDVDARLDAMKWVPEFRAASRQLGHQTARVGAALGADPFLGALEAAVREDRTPGHHAAVFGAVAGRQGAGPEPAAAAFLYTTAAALATAALRLLRLGQLDAQRVLAAVRPLVARLARAAAARRPRDMWSFTPGLELAGVRHAALEARLFRS